MRQILNLRDKTIAPGICCDRNTVLGNPFYMRREMERDVVCDAFEHYFNLVANEGLEPRKAVEETLKLFNVVISKTWKAPLRSGFITALALLQQNSSVPLLCWCVPKRCHCQTYVNWEEGK